MKYDSTQPRSMASGNQPPEKNIKDSSEKGNFQPKHDALLRTVGTEDELVSAMKVNDLVATHHVVLTVIDAKDSEGCSRIL